MAQLRVYREGADDGADVSLDAGLDLVGSPGTVVWIDLGPDDGAQVPPAIVDRLGLHPAAVRDALAAHPRSSYQHYPQHDFLSGRTVSFDPERAEVRQTPFAAFLTGTALLTVHQGADFPRAAVVEHCDAASTSVHGHPGFLLHGVLEAVVQGQYQAVSALDDALDDLEDQLFTGNPNDMYVQRRSHDLRKCVVQLRRYTLPTADSLDRLISTNDNLVDDHLLTYFRGLSDHANRVSEWTDSQRDTVSTILQTRMALADSRMNVISKKVSGWAALIGVPALITGFFGINVPYPGVGRVWGFAVCCAVLVGSFAALYATFKRHDWL
jgi:magnesium transporter